MYVEKELKKEITQIRDFLLSLVAALPAGVIVIDLEGVVITANQEAINLLGKQEKRISEIIDKDISSVIAGLPDLEKKLQECIRHRRFKIFIPELRIAKEGKDVFLAVIGKPISQGMMILLEDITHIKHEKDLLTEEKIKNEAIFASIGDGLIVTDDKGNIVQVNETFEKLLGWSAKEVIGKKMLDVVQKMDENGEIIPPSKRSLTRVLTGEISVGRESSIVKTHSYIRKDKSRLPVMGVVTPMMLDNKILGAVQVFRDISFEKEIDQMKTEFLSVAAHQLRTPLGAIRWNTEMLLSDDFGKLPDSASETVKHIYESIIRLIHLVNDLLDVSRIEQGKVADEPVLTDIWEIINAVCQDSKNEIEKKPVIVDCQLKKDQIPQIMIDPKRLRMVFENLLSNALRYNRPNGKVTVSVEKTDHELLLRVADTGIGIPQKDQHRIFSKFFRAANAVKSETEGSGLGLAVVKSYVEGWGGKVSFESEEGKGTIFTIIIPLKQK